MEAVDSFVMLIPSAKLQNGGQIPENHTLCLVLRLYVFVALKIHVMVFWVTTLYSSMNGYQQFGGTNHL